MAIPKEAGPLTRAASRASSFLTSVPEMVPGAISFLTPFKWCLNQRIWRWEFLAGWRSALLASGEFFLACPFEATGVYFSSSSSYRRRRIFSSHGLRSSHRVGNTRPAQNEIEDVVRVRQ